MSGALRVLVVEDEAIIAMSTEDMLVALGHRTAGIAASLDEALAAIERGGFDLALLDINLGGEDSTPAADRLAALAVPFVFTTGYGEARVPEAHRAAPVLDKPFGEASLATAIERATA